MLAIMFLILVISTLVGYTLGYMFTETKYRLARYPLFQFKAFECRKCLSFHITWVLATFFSALFYSWEMFITGLFFATMLFIGLKIDEKNRTITIEEYDKLTGQ